VLSAARRALGRLLPRGQVRYEAFGGIAALERPSALVFLDRDFMRSLGMTGHPVWASARRGLTAPVEAHLTLTSRCPVGCRACYVDATVAGRADDADAAFWDRAVDELARMRVFHLALGGGEAALSPTLLRVARRARARGLVPNVTTSGIALPEELLEAADVFGQVNVSIDGIGDGYAAVRGTDVFGAADRAVRTLVARGFRVGLNVVLTRQTFDRLGEVVAYARARGIREVEILRCKPVGRGADVFAAITLTPAQRRALLPMVLGLARRERVRLRLDCSMAPFVCAHDPDPEVLAFLGIGGCMAGDHLVSADAAGRVSGCSFLPPPPEAPRLDALSSQWDAPRAFSITRDYVTLAPEPCRSCRYLTLCRGGCRAVAAHAGDAGRPDPECPRVETWASESAQPTRADARCLAGGPSAPPRPPRPADPCGSDGGASPPPRASLAGPRLVST
jgi:radical SAM protein with 4Fe4S-binding SPASM domain